MQDDTVSESSSASDRLPLALIVHPRMPCDAVDSILVGYDLPSPQVLTLTFTVTGKLARLAVPEPKPIQRTDFLWQHTCFEAFVAAGDAPAYHEINLSPSTEWAIYGFRSYREIESIGENAAALQITSASSTEHLQLTARIDLSLLAATYGTTPLRIGLNAVIEETDGNLSYWALHHPCEQADFHHRDAFALRLPTRD